MSIILAAIPPDATDRANPIPAAAARGVILIASLAGLAAAILWGDHAAIDPDLARLLRAMALIKAGMAVVLLLVLWWRLAAPVTPIRLIFYQLASMMMAAGPRLIWDFAHIGLGAALLHGGLFALLVMLWRDPATLAELTRLIRRRSH